MKIKLPLLRALKSVLLHKGSLLLMKEGFCLKYLDPPALYNSSKDLCRVWSFLTPKKITRTSKVKLRII